ncbi:MAG: alcohol dehydrogenase catalytic domain-containing protein [Candidatus Latescibacteria bacterium]|nr:alcohol dehydrogenase catalytic domain-containing protein [Candidatus Latescibacterota bacterium]
MKAVRVYDLDDIRIEDFPVPPIGPRDALVRIKACGICSGDVMPWYIKRKVPFTAGHEPSGIIEQMGSEVEGFQPGDRVFIHHHAPCLTCRLCRRGFYSMCETWRRSKLVPGGIAEFVRVPEMNLTIDTLKLPRGVSFEDGALIEPTACSVKAIKRARVGPGDIVLIIGMGVMGILNLMVTRHYGAKMVIGADIVPYRLQKARTLGADIVIDVSQGSLPDQLREATDGVMADVVIVGPGSVEAMKTGMACAGKGGTVLLFTPAPEEALMNVSPYDLYFNEVTLMTSYSCGPYDTREALDLVEAGVVSAEKVVTHRFPIEETATGFRTVAAGKESLKVLIVFE